MNDLLHWLTGTRLQVPTKLVPVDTATALLALLVLMPALRQVRSRPAWRLAAVRAAATGTGALVGLVACWVVGDVMNAFDVAFTSITRMWAVIAFAGIGLATAGLVQGRRWRRVAAGLLVPLVLLATGLGINVDFAAYPTLNALLQTSPLPPLVVPTPQPGADGAVAAAEPSTWTAPADMPKKGQVGQVAIPATASRFRARPAVVYLPPAALTAAPPRLPVILSLSGQPGSPSDMFLAGDLTTVMDKYAAAHGGIAPIVISADHLGVPGHNPMCLDSPLGNVDTYLTKDVPAWAASHLTVRTSGWAVLGFSSGGTCTAQLGASHPDLLRDMLAISGQRAPVDRGEQNTIDEAFRGSRAKYRAAAPAALFAARTDADGQIAIFAYGQNDSEYGTNARALARATERLGIPTTVLESPGTSHDWNTVRYALDRGIPVIANDLLQR